MYYLCHYILSVLYNGTDNTPDIIKIRKMNGYITDVNEAQSIYINLILGLY